MQLNLYIYGILSGQRCLDDLYNGALQRNLHETSISEE